MGHGLQMWLQLMWFLARSAEDGTVVLDEPDVYMHPDLQRRLLRLILTRNQQVIVATHSIEMMAEVEPDDLVVIDSTKRRARRTRSIAELQQVVEQLGGVHNLAFARLARASACILAPVSDLRLLERWHQLVQPRESEHLAVLPTFPCEGWEAWPFVRAAKRSIDAVRSEPIRALCLLPGGGLPPDFLSARLAEAAQDHIELVVWPRRAVAGYLLDPFVIARLVAARSSHTDVTPSLMASQIAETLESDMASVIRAVESAWRTVGQPDPIGPQLLVDEAWRTLDGRMALVDPRLTVLRLSRWSATRFGVKFGLMDVAGEFRPEDLHPDVAAVLRVVGSGAAPRLPVEEGAIRWPQVDGVNVARSGEPVDTANLFELLDL